MKHCSHCGDRKWLCLCRFFAEQVDSDELRKDRKEYEDLLQKTAHYERSKV